jgi:hypothetical protein
MNYLWYHLEQTLRIALAACAELASWSLQRKCGMFIVVEMRCPFLAFLSP